MIYIHFYKSKHNKWKVWGYLKKQINADGNGYNIAFAFGLFVIRYEFGIK